MSSNKDVFSVLGVKEVLTKEQEARIKKALEGYVIYCTKVREVKQQKEDVHMSTQEVLDLPVLKVGEVVEGLYP